MSNRTDFTKIAGIRKQHLDTIAQCIGSAKALGFDVSSTELRLAKINKDIDETFGSQLKDGGQDSLSGAQLSDLYNYFANLAELWQEMNSTFTLHCIYKMERSEFDSLAAKLDQLPTDVVVAAGVQPSAMLQSLINSIGRRQNRLSESRRAFEQALQYIRQGNLRQATKKLTTARLFVSIERDLQQHLRSGELVSFI
jgi:hypothetical protein